MGLSMNDITVYRASSWGEGNGHGGNIGSVKITSNTDQNIFDDVSDAERVAGDIEYRKIYIRNGKAATAWDDVRCWLSLNSTAANDDIFICAGGKSSFQGQIVVLKPGTATFTHGSGDVTGVGTKFLTDLAVGEVIYNATDDTVADAAPIVIITSNTELTMAVGYTGTTGATKFVGIAPITNSNVMWVQPDSKAHSDTLALGTLYSGSTTDYKAIWIKREVTAGIPNGYKNDIFTLTFEPL